MNDRYGDSECRSCLGTSYTDEDRCGRCGRPRHEPVGYLEEIEDLARDVVVKAYEEIDEFGVGQGEREDLRGAIARLGARLRSYHYDGDGCLDH